MGRHFNRPWCCPEPRCTPVHQLGNEAVDLSRPTPGESFLCFGEAPEVVFIYDGVEHKNDLRSCSYTALKGVIANQENRDDWWLLARHYTAALSALKETPDDA